MARVTTEKKFGDREYKIYAAFQRTAGLLREGKAGPLPLVLHWVSAQLAHQWEQQGWWAATCLAEGKPTDSASPVPGPLHARC